jgi:hypothetical protein
MTAIVPIVEGDGEVEAVPILLRRIAEWRASSDMPMILQPLRVKRDKFLNKHEEFNRVLILAARKLVDPGWILILLDADDDCPVTLASKILDRCRQVVAHKAVSVVLAKREYEAWFIAASESLNGYRGLVLGQGAEIDPEAKRDAKGWMRERMANGYREVLDQPAFSSRMNLKFAYERSRSFKKFCDEVQKQMQFCVGAR